MLALSRLWGLYFILFYLYFFCLEEFPYMTTPSPSPTPSPQMQLIISDQPQMPFPPSLARGNCFFLCVCLVEGFISLCNLPFISYIPSGIPVYVYVLLGHKTFYSNILVKLKSLIMLSIFSNSSDINKCIIHKYLRHGLSSNFWRSRA